jgi:ubiquinone/menaquinone biosynthesis C-methylase UbiE
MNNNNWTGERLETFIFNENTLEHLHRYAVASSYIKNKIVLDIASGEGYGSNLLAQKAAKVIGVDIDEASITLAESKYKASNLEFRVGRADAIPLENSSVEVVVSFETLEHHDKHDEMMNEVKRVLKPGGILIISTPEKKYYTDKKNYNNPFHVKELYLNEFKSLLNSHFSNTQFYLQNMFNGSLIIPENMVGKFKNYKGDFNAIDLSAHFFPMYVVGIASDADLGADIFASAFTSETVEQKTHEELYRKVREEGANWIKGSMSYRLGNFLLSPLKLFKK